MNIKNFKLFRISELETIEEKSFWITAPFVALIGVAGLGTAGLYSAATPTIISAILCLVFPLALMFYVYKKKNYHTAYPLLCISIGAISIPVTFLFSGGFLSGMPLFCALMTGICALCYSSKYRYTSFVVCLIGNTIAFYYVYKNGSPFPLQGTEPLYDFKSSIEAIYNDVLFGYYCSAVGLFFSINFITNDIRRYKLNQDALQKFFDIEKRKEILRQTLKSDSQIKTEHKNATILFADISNFTPITEKLSSDILTKFLNEFFSIAGKYIHETGGIIDKYIGDCVMAYWLDKDGENSVLNAVQAMLNLKFEVLRKAELINAEYGTELNFSVGIAYGDVIFGDIGSESMHDFTVIGDAVNTASRIQEFAVSGEMLISDQAAEMIKDSVRFEKVEANHYFKGKNKSIDLYRITGLKTKNEENQITEKQLLGYTITICGCRGSFPVSGLRFSEYGGETSCYVIRHEDYAVIVDCGTGLKNAMELVSDCKKIDVLLTHVHYDHILGLLMSRFPKEAQVRFFVHYNQWKSGNTTLEDFMMHPYWPVQIQSANTINIVVGEEIQLEKGISAKFYLSDHPDEACVIRVNCLNKKIVFLADCEDATKLSNEIAQDANLLFFDGMFDDEDQVDHTGWGHGTWQAGIRYLDGRNIQKMVITHHSPENGDHSLKIKENQARALAQNVSFAKSGDRYIL